MAGICNTSSFYTFVLVYHTTVKLHYTIYSCNTDYSHHEMRNTPLSTEDIMSVVELEALSTWLLFVLFSAINRQPSTSLETNLLDFASAKACF